MLKRTFAVLASTSVLLGNNISYAVSNNSDPQAAEIKARVKAESEVTKKELDGTIVKEEKEMEAAALKIQKQKINKNLRDSFDSSKNKLSAEEDLKIRKLWTYNSEGSSSSTSIT